MDKFTPLHIGAAYHGNRMPSHAYNDLKSMAAQGFDTVVHMLSHTDWERYTKAMKEIIAMSDHLGFDVWVDNWGLGGPPGDKSHFLAYHPEAHAYFWTAPSLHHTPASIILRSENSLTIG